MIHTGISVGGTLHRVTCLDDGKVYVQDRHNMVVDQGMRLLLSIPDTNPCWHKDDTDMTGAVFGNIVTGVFGQTIPIGFIPHFGIASYMACGSSDVATSTDMTQLGAFEGDASSADSYGAVKVDGSTQGTTSFVTDASSTSVTYSYIYKAKSSFTCREFGTYCMVPTSTFTTNEFSFTMAKVDAKLFSRVVLTEPVDMVAGNRYIFTYTLRFGRSSTVDTLDTLFGLPAVQTDYSTGTRSVSDFNKYLPGIKLSDNIFYLYNASNTFSLEAYDTIAYLGYGFVNFTTDLKKSSNSIRTPGIANSAPIWIWTDTARSTVKPSFSNSSTPDCYSEDTYFHQTDAVVPSRAYDVVGDFYGIKTYHLGKPFTDTTSKYLSVVWGNVRWWVNDDGTAQSPYGRDNDCDYTITCKTVLTREGA